jgi:two-component system KDP operon response regulator KdpE
MAERKLESNQSGPSILMVEDNKYVALALKIRFKKLGYDVCVASTVSEALEAVASQPPDIALLDYNLPDGNGIELMQMLLQSEATADVRTIIMTASKRIGLKEEAMMKGAFEFFEKPFDSCRLVEAVKVAVSASSPAMPELACAS